MASFRIKVDLSEYFDDCRKESYIFVKQEWEAIKLIAGHISRIFNLNAKTPVLVTGDGVYLPPEESIQILTQSDTIKVCRNSPAIPSEPIRLSKFSNRSNSTLLDHCNLPALFATNETPIVPAEILLKKRNPVGAAQLKKSKLSINFDNPLLMGKNQASEEDDDDEEEDEEVTPNISQKKKRKRVRKRKNKTAAGAGNSGGQSTPVASNGITQNGSSGGAKGQKKNKMINNSNSMNGNSKSNNHTKFSASDTESSSSSEEEEDEKSNLQVSTKFRAETIPPISRIIKGIRTSCPAGLEAIQPPPPGGKGDGVTEKGKTNGEVLPIDDDSEIIDGGAVDESEYHEANADKPIDVSASFQDASKSTHLDTLRKALGTYPALETLPNKNDYIGFRILKMSENYVPELSEYVIGLVETVDEETMDLEIVVLAGNEELKQHQEGGKFSLPDCNDTLVDMDENTLHINWIELKDVRLVNL